MLCDHVGDAIIGSFTFINYIGRIAFPIFAFQLVVSYKNTKDLKKYVSRLVIFAVISQAPFMLFLSTFSKDILTLNILFTMLLGVGALFAYDKIKNKFLGFLSVILISIFAQFIKVDYGAFAILLMFLFYIFQDKKVCLCISSLLLCVMKYIPLIIATPTLYWHYLLCALFTFLPTILFIFYNKKQGPKLKYFFYIFYPLHLLILYLISL